jgi:hypothetical protein
MPGCAMPGCAMPGCAMPSGLVPGGPACPGALWAAARLRFGLLPGCPAARLRGGRLPGCAVGGCPAARLARRRGGRLRSGRRRGVDYLVSGWTLGWEPLWNGMCAPLARLTIVTQEPPSYWLVTAPRAAST